MYVSFTLLWSLFLIFSVSIFALFPSGSITAEHTVCDMSVAVIISLVAAVIACLYLQIHI